MNSHPDVPEGLADSLIIGSRRVAVDDENIARWASPAEPGTVLSGATATVDHAMAALGEASAAQHEWSMSSLDARLALIAGYREFLADNAEAFARLIVLESGKTIGDARAEVRVTGAVVDELVACAATALSGFEGGDVSVHVTTSRRAVGPALLITPWNFPLSLASRKVVSALLAGCAFVLKPSERTPLTSMLMVTGLIQSGLPTGVGSVIPSLRSDRIVAALTDDRRLRKISFTGSTAVGRIVLQASTTHFQRVSLELGGNAPAIIAPAADLATAVRTIWAAKIFNNGQACTAPNRVLVARSVARKARDLFTEAALGTEVGDPWSDETRLASLISEQAAQRLRQMIGAAHGGDVVGAVGSSGAPNALQATMVFDPRPDDPLCQEELFGPVLPLITYDDDDLEDALRIANSTDYGLASYVFGPDSAETLSIASGIDAGMVAFNWGSVSHPQAAFGGTKHSGFGRENGVEGIRQYLETHTLLRPPASQGGAR